jgi:hypothetical protein
VEGHNGENSIGEVNFCQLDFSHVDLKPVRSNCSTKYSFLYNKIGFQKVNSRGSEFFPARGLIQIRKILNFMLISKPFTCKKMSSKVLEKIIKLRNVFQENRFPLNLHDTVQCTVK